MLSIKTKKTEFNLVSSLLPVPINSVPYMHWGVRVRIVEQETVQEVVTYDGQTTRRLVKNWVYKIPDLVFELNRDKLNKVESKVKIYISQDWRESFFLGERTIAKIELLKATITHPMNKSKYHLANNNCQKWVRHFLARIDRKLNEKKIAKRIPEGRIYCTEICRRSKS